MRYSTFFAPTLRDVPAEAEVVSHQLLLRAGFIRRVTSGVYDFLPLGLRVLRKIEQIVREEMNRAGAQELLMPMVQPAELWRQSGRWEKYGKELLRFTDRHEHESCLGPTHEEVICDLVRRELRSYRQLPVNLYQIQNKFRDEVRPRFGLMRGREFIMKDAYSFHADDEDLAREYRNMFDAYSRIFRRMGLKFRAVEADTGSIGGSSSHEFHVLAQSGEDEIVHCSVCDYAANVEMASGNRPEPNGDTSDLTMVSTPGKISVEDVAGFLEQDPSLFVKTMMYRVSGGPEDGKIVAVCVRGDDQVQELKLLRSLHAEEVVLADDESIKALGSSTGFSGPQGLDVKVIADDSLQGGTGLVAGANEKDCHVVGLDMARDVPQAIYRDVRRVRAGDSCTKCGANLELTRGIEVGHVFELGRCYTEPMEVEFQDKHGKRAVATMGCYGIGVSRLLAAVVEQCHDEAGMIWPLQLAPFHVSIITIGKADSVVSASGQIYEDCREAGIEVLWDDRPERPGVKFNDIELMGLPLCLVVGERGLARGEIECRIRGGDQVHIPLSDVVHTIQDMMKDLSNTS
jgi:prolyl-tRNA synthetase